MRIVIAGAHGQIARRLGRLLTGRGDTVVGIIRNPAHESDVVGDGVDAVVLDLETASVGGGRRPRRRRRGGLRGGRRAGQRASRKDTVDRGAAVLLADAAERAGVARYLLISSMGVDTVADGATPDGVDDVFVAYLRAKLAAEQDLLARSGARASTVLRPGGLDRRPGHRPGDAWPGRSSGAASPGTTSPPCWSRCWTPARTARCSSWWRAPPR